MAVGGNGTVDAASVQVSSVNHDGSVCNHGDSKLLLHEHGRRRHLAATESGISG